jgi:hypothetical protein
MGSDVKKNHLWRQSYPFYGSINTDGNYTISTISYKNRQDISSTERKIKAINRNIFGYSTIKYLLMAITFSHIYVTNDDRINLFQLSELEDMGVGRRKEVVGCGLEGNSAWEYCRKPPIQEQGNQNMVDYSPLFTYFSLGKLIRLDLTNWKTIASFSARNFD